MLRRRNKLTTGLGALLALTLVSAACGGGSGDEDVEALLNESKTEAPAGSPAPEAATEAPAAPAEGASPAPAEAPTATPAPSAAPATPSAPVAPKASASAPKRPAASGQAPAPAAKPAPAPAPSGSSGSGSQPAPAPARGAAPVPAPGTPAPAPGAPAPGAAAPVAPATCTGSEAPIVIGSVGTLSGVVGYLFTPGIVAIQSWAADINAKGGINCHKIKYIQGDDGGDPARHQSIIKSFVEKDKVTAFVFNPAPFSGQASAEYLNGKGVPVIGQEGGQLFYYDSPMHFPVYSNGDMMQLNEVFQASKVWIPAGLKKVASLSCVEAEYCNLFDKTVAEHAPKLGFELLSQAKATLTAPDYTSNCIQFRNDGAQALITSLDAQTNHRLLASCAKVGLKIPLVSASLQGSYDYADDPNMDGTIIGHNTRPWFGNHPAVGTYLNALKTFAKGEDAKAGPGSINGWVSALAFEAAAQGIAANAEPTPTAIVNGLYALNGNDLGGLTYPLRFEPNKPKKKIACGYPVVSNGKGKFTAPAEIACMPGFAP